MLLRFLGLLFDDPIAFFILVPIVLATLGVALLVAITVHEFSHALAAYRLGDTTAKHLGRLTLNPIAHLDPMGTLMLLLVGFGWGKPVPINPYQLRNGIRTGSALVSAAGPLSNLVTAAVFAIPIRSGVLAWHSPGRLTSLFEGGIEGIAADVIGLIIFYNIILAAFNILPLAPLDGFKIALGLLPRKLSILFSRLETYGPAILLLIIMVDFLTGAGLLFGIIRPIANTVSIVVLGKAIM
ncbi:MAG: site-2 protease family protein [Chloroflexi bacterium]|nr:site-2 protease family protein [Chloroflexota bacterium]